MLKILHTADWHVGARLRGRSRLGEQRGVLAELVALASAERVDLVLVAGDLFDSRAPSPDAEDLVWQTLLALRDTGAVVVAVAGNHDHARRLAALAPVFGRIDRLHLVVEPPFGTATEDAVFRLVVRGIAVEIATLPWVSHAGVLRSRELMGLSASGQALLFTEYLRQRVGALGRALSGDRVRLLVGHLMVVGAATSGSERLAQCGPDYALSALAFDPERFDYVALGHVHRRQRVAGEVQVWYSGPPLRLDFGESTLAPGALLIEVAAGIRPRVREVTLQSARPLTVLAGQLADLREAAHAASVDGAYLKLELTDPPRPGLADEVRRELAAAVDIRVQPPAERAGGMAVSDPDEGTPAGLARAQEPDRLFARYLASRGEANDELVGLFGELYRREVEGSDEASDGSVANVNLTSDFVSVAPGGRSG